MGVDGDGDADGRHLHTPENQEVMRSPSILFNHVKNRR